MKKKLLALFCILLAGMLSGCQLRGFIDRTRFAVELAGFSSVFADAESYVFESSSSIDVGYTLGGRRYGESVESSIESTVYLSDFMVDVAIQEEYGTTHMRIFREEETYRVYQLLGEDILIPQDIDETAVTTLCGCTDDGPDIGFSDFDGITRRDDGTYAMVVDLGAQSGFGYEMATSIATTSGLDRSEFADQTVDVEIAFDREAGTLDVSATLSEFDVTIEGIDFTFEITAVTAFAFKDVPERDEPDVYYLELPTQRAEATTSVAVDELVNGYVAGGHRTGWIKVELTAGDYRLIFDGNVQPYTVLIVNAVGTTLRDGATPVYTVPSDGVYYIGFESSAGYMRFDFTLDRIENP